MTDALTHRPDRAVLSLTGPDTLALLERLVTNNVKDWPGGEARYGALLTPQGKVIADFIALRQADGVWLDVAADVREDLAKRLKMFRLRSAVEITPCDDLMVCCAPASAPGSFPDPRHPGMPHRAIVSATTLEPDPDYDTARIECGLPEQGKDFQASEVFPADINMDIHGGIDLKKGCFVGQEVVSRMHRRGNIRKRTVTLAACRSDNAQMPPGASFQLADVYAEQTPLGTVSSYSGDLALARLRIDRLAHARQDGTGLKAGENPVSLRETAWLKHEIAAHQNHD